VKTYIIAAAGTGGHIHPGLAIAGAISENEPNSRIFFVGTRTGMENRLISDSPYSLIRIRAKGFDRKVLWKSISSLGNFILGLIQSLQIIKKHKPDLVVGMGGYISAPVAIAAYLLNKPVLLHEQNSAPGKANLWLSKYADIVCISYPKTLTSFKNANSVVLTGNPVRKEFYGITSEKARTLLRISPDMKLLYITGGSLGARSINQAVIRMVEMYENSHYRIILACGRNDFKDVIEHVGNRKQFLKIGEYFLDQHLYLAAADLVVCRAGAITCSEIAILGKPSIMIPYPFAAGDHQTLNARAFSDIDAAVLIPDRELSGERLNNAINELMSDDEKRTRLGKNALTLAYPSATDLIYQQIQKLTGQVGLSP
jgi:UDP-N-acetylglucosamine--N-acetylmuramyl-(pentapeptide) pyrophosphoryl-undecaprenol N-acetylglucosamine transferase